jgi:hypothetical protein
LVEESAKTQINRVLLLKEQRESKQADLEGRLLDLTREVHELRELVANIRSGHEPIGVARAVNGSGHGI